MDQPSGVQDSPALDPSVLLSQSHTLHQLNHTWYHPDAHYHHASASDTSTSVSHVSSYAHNPEQPQASSSIVSNAEQGAKPKHVARKERRLAREREKPPLNALLPDEIIPEPPHNPDEQVEASSMRPCSMAKLDVPAPLRCYVMLRPDYVFKMCESCRMKFKLAEMRKNGVRYAGKYKATAQPHQQEERPDGRFKGKGRPHLIQYNGELILDPAFMHTYELDSRMFGPNGSQHSAEALEDAEFAIALKKAADSVRKRSKSRETSTVVAGSASASASVEPDATPVPTSTTSVEPLPVPPPVPFSRESSELAHALTMPPEKPDYRNYRGGLGGSTVSHVPGGVMSEAVAQNKTAAQPDDGLLRVRICTVKNCHNPVPVDYFWKMCQPCRDNYRAWGVTKRQKRREKRLQELAETNKEKYENLLARSKMRKHGKEEVGDHLLNDNAPFDPTIPPRPCTIPNCKNHVPGNSIYKRCKMHRRETRNYYSTANGRREKQREIFRKAKEEGRDPAEALREFMQSTQSGDEDSEGDESGDDDEKKRKRRRRSSVPSSVDGVDDPSTPGGSSKKTGEITRLTICVGKDCANLLDVQREPHIRSCIVCKPPPAPRKRLKKVDVTSPQEDTRPPVVIGYMPPSANFQRVASAGMGVPGVHRHQPFAGWSPVYIDPTFQTRHRHRSKEVVAESGGSEASSAHAVAGSSAPSGDNAGAADPTVPGFEARNNTAAATDNPIAPSVITSTLPSPTNPFPVRHAQRVLDSTSDPTFDDFGTTEGDQPVLRADVAVENRGAASAPVSTQLDVAASVRISTPALTEMTAHATPTSAQTPGQTQSDTTTIPSGSGKSPPKKSRKPTSARRSTAASFRVGGYPVGSASAPSQSSYPVQARRSSLPAVTPSTHTVTPTPTPAHPAYPYGWPPPPYPYMSYPPPPIDGSNPAVPPHPHMHPYSMYGFPPPPYVMPPIHASGATSSSSAPSYPHMYPYPPYPYGMPAYPHLPPPEAYPPASQHAPRVAPRLNQSAPVSTATNLPPLKDSTAADANSSEQRQQQHPGGPGSVNAIPDYIFRFLPPAAQAALQAQGIQSLATSNKDTECGDVADPNKRCNNESEVNAPASAGASSSGSGVTDRAAVVNGVEQHGEEHPSRGETASQTNTVKMCASARCITSLPKAHPHKHCNDCRKKAKSLKMMKEMKRRRKLVNRSSSVKYKSSHNGELSAVVDEDDDADADGDADADHEVELQL